MSALSVQPSYPIFTDTDGQPLEDGYIWIGTVNQDPQGNPVNVYWDAALTQPAGQPIRTLNGYPANNGTPARMYVGADYSIRVLDKRGVMVYASLNDNSFLGGGAVSNATGNGVQVLFPLSASPSAIYINGVYQNRNTYSFAAGVLTFTQAPPITSIIEFVF